MPQRLRGQIHFGVCHLRALWRRAVGQAEMLKIQSWRTVVPGSPQSTAHQKRRPNCSIADGTHGARGSGADPQLPCPTTPGGTTSSGPAFLTERHRSPGYVELSPAGSCGRPGTRAGPGGGVRSPALHPRPTPPAPPPSSSPATKDAVVPRVRDPGGSVPEDAGSRALPTCLPLRRRPKSRLLARAGRTRSPERPGQRRLLQDWRPE